MKFWTVANGYAMMSHDLYTKLKDILNKLPAEDGQYICRLISSDPLTFIYWKLLVAYSCILSIFLLWPFDFHTFTANDARWLKSPPGIEFLETGQALSESAHQEFFEHMIKGSGLTLELWVAAADSKQTGPARILSFSKNFYRRNFTIGQAWDQLVVRLRTTKTSLNGTNPHLIVENVFNDQNLQHVVFTYNYHEQRVYINGEQKTQSKVVKGDFSNWDPSCKLVIGNEATGQRPWQGKIYYAAVFDRPLKEQEIRQNYLAGLRAGVAKSTSGTHIDQAQAPVTRYLFNEGQGDVIKDSGSNPDPVNLVMPTYIRQGTQKFLNYSLDYFHSSTWLSDVIINILIFIPLGFLIHGMLRSRNRTGLKATLLALFAGAIFTVGIETIQFFSLTRNSSLIDVFMNMTGTAVGIATDKFYVLYLNHRAGNLQMLLEDRTDETH